MQALPIPACANSMENPGCQGTQAALTQGVLPADVHGRWQVLGPVLLLIFLGKKDPFPSPTCTPEVWARDPVSLGAGEEGVSEEKELPKESQSQAGDSRSHRVARREGH